MQLIFHYFKLMVESNRDYSSTILSCIFLLILGIALVIPPLQTIQQQMEQTCMDWQIPCINLSKINPKDIKAKIEVTQPKVILTSIEDIVKPEVQSELQLLSISYVAVDECQVRNISIPKFFFCKLPVSNWLDLAPFL